MRVFFFAYVVPHGASVEAPAAPEKEGHTFGG